jgi:hypothetical protein
VFANAAVKPVLPLPSRSETRIRIKRAFRGLFGARLDLPGKRIPKGTLISMGSSPDQRWVPKAAPKRNRLYRFFTESAGALYTGMFVLFQGRNARGGRPLVPTEEWDTTRPPPRPIGGGVPSKLGGKNP